MRKIIFLVLFVFMLTSVFSAVADYRYNLRLDSVSTYPSTLYPGSEVTFNMSIENISEISDATDIEIKSLADERYFKTIIGEDSIDVIKFNTTATSNLKFKIKDDVPGGYYTIPLNITYDRGESDYITIETQATITIGSYQKINIVLTNYPKSKVYLDEEVEIRGYIENVGSSTLKGVFIDTNYGTNKLIPLNETTQFLGDIDPMSRADYNFSILVPKSAEPDTYTIDISAQDVESNSSTEKVAFIVEDKPKLIISSIDKSISNGLDYVTQGSNFSISIQLENISKSKAKSVVMKIPQMPEGFTGSSLTYVGSIDADDSGAGIFDLKAESVQAGESIIDVKIIYTDEYDVEHSFTEQVSIFVERAPLNLGFVWLIIILGLIGGGVYFYYKKYKKTKSIAKIK